MSYLAKTTVKVKITAANTKYPRSAAAILFSISLFTCSLTFTLQSTYTTFCCHKESIFFFSQMSDLTKQSQDRLHHSLRSVHFFFSWLLLEKAEHDPHCEDWTRDRDVECLLKFFFCRERVLGLPVCINVEYCFIYMLLLSYRWTVRSFGNRCWTTYQNSTCWNWMG